MSAELSLSGWVSLEVFRTLLVFIRIGAAMMVLPGFGEPPVPVRVRVLAALAIAMAVSASVDGMPGTTPDAGGLVVAVLAEAINGALLGLLCRTLIAAVLMAGQVISQSIGLSNIFTAGMAIDHADTIGATLYAGVVAVLFASGAYQHILRGLIDSYHLLPPAAFPAAGASAQAIVSTGVRALRIACQIAVPFLVLALLFNAVLAAVNRAMPSMPVFMMANPVLVILGLYLLAACVPAILDPTLGDWSDLSTLLR
jgi:flagellar biosynthetic protein FliR